MGSYLKTAVLALAAATCIYGVLFVDIADKPLAAHAADVWRSAIVQHKLELLGRELRLRLRNGLHWAETTAGMGAKEITERAPQPRAELSQDDREFLHALIDSAQRAP